MSSQHATRRAVFHFVIGYRQLVKIQGAFGPMPREGRVTRLIHAAREGDQAAEHALFSQVHDELRQIARRRIQSSNTDFPTDGLVSELYLKLQGRLPEWVDNRREFLRLASAAVRTLLLDHARRKQTDKRAYESATGALMTVNVPVESQPSDAVDVDLALQDMARELPDVAELAVHHYLGQLRQVEIAELTGLSRQTVARKLKLARAWLKRRLAHHQ